jgi:hypothetical protein
MKRTHYFGGLYTSGRGWTHEEIDQGGNQLANRLLNMLQAEIGATQHPRLKIEAVIRSHVPLPGLQGYRGTIPPHTIGVHLHGVTVAPAQAALEQVWAVLVPRADSEHEDYAIKHADSTEIFFFPMEDVISGDDTTTELRLEMLAGRIIAKMILVMRAQADSVLRSKGY